MTLELIENKDRDLSFLENNLPTEEELKLVNPSANFPFENEYWQNFFRLDGRATSYLLKDGNEPIGHTALRYNPESGTVWLCWVLVKHSYRGKGVSQKLIQLTEKFVLEEYNKQEYFLNVRKHNERAIEFYKRIGFSIISEGDGNFQMKKSLA